MNNKKTLLGATAIIVGLGIVGGAVSNSIQSGQSNNSLSPKTINSQSNTSPNSETNPPSTTQPTVTPQPTPTPTPITTPSYNPAEGATALCNDGTYSYAANHQGACSHHGGVAVFYK